MNEELVRAVARALVSQCAKIMTSPDDEMPADGIAQEFLVTLEQAGYAVVPREPTMEMILDGGDEIGSYNLEMDGSYRLAKDAYKAMLAAAERDDG